MLLRLHELDQFEDAALVKAEVAALFTGFITDPDGTAGGLSGTNTGGALTVGMEPGSLIPLPPGTDIRFSNSTEHDAYAPFVKNHLRAVAAGLGLPYELVSGDLEGVTYSSIRAGLIEFRRRVEQLQHNVVVQLFCRPVWERFVRLAVLTGDLPARDFDRDPAAYLACEWLPPKFDYVDPKKDVEAEILAINAGLKSRRQAISERGYDAEQVDAEIAADKARSDALGLNFGAPPRRILPMTDTITLLTRRADLAPASADRDARTVEVIWSTGAPVRRRDMAGQYIERLSLDLQAVDLSRLQGASVLDAHRQSAVRDVLGSVQSAAVDGQRGTALIRFSARPEVEPLWQDVLSGILRHVSVGYSVEDWAETTENAARVLTATRWTPHEISLVPTPADPGAHIRMETDMTKASSNVAADNNASPQTDIVGTANDVQVGTRTVPGGNGAQSRAAINTAIRSIARIAGLDQSWIDGQIDAATDPDTARRAAFEALARRSAPAIRTEQVRVEMSESQDDPALRARQMGEALYARINPRHQLSDPARRYAYATPVDMAKELLTLRGESTMALSPAEARILVTLLEANGGNGPTLSNTKALFHADHGNKAGTGAVISDATLSAARLALRTQKGTEDRTIRVTPKSLLVPPALETVAEKWLATIAPATAADVNPFSGTMSLVVEPRLTSATRWYVTADPGEIDGLEFAYLSGAEGPQVESRSGWDVDGVEIRVILDFGAGFIDHRGWFMNAGA